MTFWTHRPTQSSTLLLFLGGGLLALAAAAAGNLLGTAACGMERPSQERITSLDVPATAAKAM